MKKYMIMILIVFMCFLFGCAEEQQVIKKPATSPNLMGDQKAPAVANKPIINKPIKEVKDIFHFMTFKSEPSGAGVYVIDANTGKETQYLGTTPVRILMLKKRVEIDGFYVVCTGVGPNATGLGLSGRDGKMEQIEFEFKFKLQGFNDDIKLERLPLNTAKDTDTVLQITLNPINGKK